MTTRRCHLLVRLTVLTLAAGLLAACAGAGDDTTTPAPTTPASTSPAAAPPSTPAPATTGAPQPASTPPPATTPHNDEDALDHFGELLNDEGVLPLDTALAVFAATEGPLTGVTPIDDVESLPFGVASIATRTVVGALDRLDPVVAAEVTETLQLGVELDTDLVVEPGMRFPRDIPVDADLVALEPLPIDEVRDRIGTVRAMFEARTGHTLTVPIRVRMPGRQLVRAYADALPLRSECIIRIFPAAFAGDRTSTMSTIAHEVWHCFQGSYFGSNPVDLPQWMVEGQAEFVGEVVVGGSTSGISWYHDWFVRPNRALQRRSYDAAGLYGVAQESGADPWRTMLPMLGQSTGRALETLFGGQSAVDAVAAIARKVAKVPDYGPDWDQNSPSPYPMSGAEVVAVPLTGVTTRASNLGTYATFPVVFSVVAGGDVLRLGTTGGTSTAMAAPELGTVIVEASGRRDFCLRPDECRCPDGTWPGEGDPPLPSGPGEFAVAIGAVGGGRVTVTAERLDLDLLCEEEPPIDLVGQWQAPIDAMFAELARPYGPFPGTCTGPFLVHFGDDLRFSTSFDVTCQNEGMTARAVAELTGSYQVGDGTFSVLGATGTGTMEMAGTTIPMPIIDGYRQGLAGPVPYTIVGDQLHYSFTAPDGNSFNFTLTRVP